MIENKQAKQGCFACLFLLPAISQRLGFITNQIKNFKALFNYLF